GLLVDQPGAALVLVQAPRAPDRARLVLRAQRRRPREPGLPRAHDPRSGRERHAPPLPADSPLPDGLPAGAQDRGGARRRLRVRPVVLRLQAPPAPGAGAAPHHHGRRPPQEVGARAATRRGIIPGSPRVTPRTSATWSRAPPSRSSTPPAASSAAASTTRARPSAAGSSPGPMSLWTPPCSSGGSGAPSPFARAAHLT